MPASGHSAKLASLGALALNLAIPCLTERVKQRHYNNMCALKNAAVRGKPLEFPLKSQKFAAVSSARISRAEYLLAQAESHFCASALNLPTPRLTERVKQRHYNNMRALKNAAVRGKPLGFPLQFAEIRSRQLGENFASRSQHRPHEPLHVVQIARNHRVVEFFKKF